MNMRRTALFVVCLVFCVVSCDAFKTLISPGALVGVGWLLFLLSVCVTSYKGHMVDALASRAEEGRSLAAISYGQPLAGVTVDLPMGQPTQAYP